MVSAWQPLLPPGPHSHPGILSQLQGQAVWPGEGLGWGPFCHRHIAQPPSVRPLSLEASSCFPQALLIPLPSQCSPFFSSLWVILFFPSLPVPNQSQQSCPKPPFPRGTLKVKVKWFSPVQLFATPWTVAHQASPIHGVFQA